MRSLRVPVGAACAGCLLIALIVSEKALAIDAQYPAAATCAWPAAVHIYANPEPNHPAGYDDGSLARCSGVYVGNHIVLTAAHCVAYMETVGVGFGEHGDAPFWSTQTSSARLTPTATSWRSRRGVSSITGRISPIASFQRGTRNLRTSQ